MHAVSSYSFVIYWIHFAFLWLYGILFKDLKHGWLIIFYLFSYLGNSNLLHILISAAMRLSYLCNMTTKISHNFLNSIRKYVDTNTNIACQIFADFVQFHLNTSALNPVAHLHWYIWSAGDLSLICVQLQGGYWVCLLMEIIWKSP